MTNPSRPGTDRGTIVHQVVFGVLLAGCMALFKGFGQEALATMTAAILMCWAVASLAGNWVRG